MTSNSTKDNRTLAWTVEEDACKGGNKKKGKRPKKARDSKEYETMLMDLVREEFKGL